MRERKTIPQEAAASHPDHRRQHVPDPAGDLPVPPSLVGTGDHSRPSYFGHFRVSPVAEQTLVKMAKEAKAMDSADTKQTDKALKPPRKKAIKALKPAKTGRPASSSDVRLVPTFRNPVDIERLGKALVAIAMKLPATPESSNRPGHAEDKEAGHGLAD